MDKNVSHCPTTVVMMRHSWCVHGSNGSLERQVRMESVEFSILTPNMAFEGKLQT